MKKEKIGARPIYEYSQGKDLCRLKKNPESPSKINSKRLVLSTPQLGEVRSSDSH